MKKTFNAILSVLLLFVGTLSAMAGDNDLLWDYTEKAPSSNPDNGLHYDSKVNDAAGTNNGLKGVKLNSKGFAWFAKPAVAGKLSLTIGLRSGAGAFCVDVYKCTIVDGKVTSLGEDGKPLASDLIATTAEVQESNAVSVEVGADITGIYIVRHTGAEGVLSKVQFKEAVPRDFTDFEITNDQLKVQGYDGSDLPSGVTFSGNDEQADSHGYRNVTITVPVDGTVRFYFGGCQYTKRTFNVKDSNGKILKAIDLTTEKCYHQDQTVVKWIYIGDATTLTFENIQYLPYFKAEAAEVEEVTVSYKDQNGKVLTTKKVFEGEALGATPENLETQLTIPDGQKFRGWIYANGVKIDEADEVSGNVSVLAKVTPIESVSVGSVQTYDMMQKTFYPEDRETISTEQGSWINASKGWSFDGGGSFSVDVAGKAQVMLTLSNEGNGTTINVTDGNGKTVASDVAAKGAVNNETVAVKYDGEATTLKFTFATQTYIHKVEVYNVIDFPVQDAETGYIQVLPDDAAGLMYAFSVANSTPNTKIFLPNGVYDFGEAVLIGLSGTNTSIIGESAENTIIKTAPDKSIEGLGKADMLFNTGTGLYLQDVTLQNAMSFDGGTGRAPALHDKGDKTICKNVKMLSYQDTYYSNKVGATYYFEGGELHGVVDFLCGDSRVYFNGCNIVTESIKAATISANSELYVFNNCTITDLGPSYNFGRAWSADGDGPKCVFLNTTLMNPSKLIGTRWNPSGINVDYTVAGEYGTKNAEGTNITPTSNVVTFQKASTTLETILTADQAALYTIEHVLGDWAATAQAATLQAAAPKATIEKGVITITPANGGDAGVYLIEKNGEFLKLTSETEVVVEENQPASFGNDVTELAPVYTVRAANAKGGFGEAAIAEEATAVEVVEAAPEAKAAEGAFVIGDKVVIIKDGKQFTAAGARIK
ncbi:MAG: hypothetical protein II626_06560 [Prevotella sp.]|nr:hypothetical protein [Prevotella sp.]